MEIDRIKYPELHSGDIIRIKSARALVIGKENVLESKSHTNILKFINDSKVVNNISNQIHESELDIVIRDKEEPTKPIYVTQNDMNPWNHLKVSSLIDLFFQKEDKLRKVEEEDSKIDEDSWRNEDNQYDRSFEFENPEDKLGARYLIDFNVLAFTPNDIKEFVQGLWSSWRMT